ncbi:FecR family protein [Frigoriglobus tundricola]|uniref:Uncharacterized protein n=1 Tax=Frigoriglobus tundricola TaxID=2774151 RepID=A0A6M5YWW4_9BACT|nr:FecR domain-containing protein [Frigoriglobus tundricola]QJW97703.1 hypothetical protein FTUN_5280 [Frigoriglobus tundricola]
MSTHPDTRFADLLVRYWDDALAPAEAEELEQRLAADPAAREWLRVFALQVVAAAELRAARPAPERPAPERPAPERPAPERPAAAAERAPTERHKPSRRRALWSLGGGLAAAVAAVAGGRWLGTGPSDPAPAADRFVRLTAIRGAVVVRGADGAELPTDGAVPTGSTIATNGPGASVVLLYPNGTNVTLTEDSAVTLGPTDDRLRLDRGALAADVQPPLVSGSALTLATSETLITSATKAVVTLTQAVRLTELGVQHGSVSVTAPGGRWLGAVNGGELLTVRSDGECRKQAHPVAPDEYALDLTRPLPAGWAVGRLAARADRPALVPEFWFDPFHQRQMFQIRSDKAWARGFFRLTPDSVVKVRYRVARPGSGQVCLCVRTPDVRSPDTGMLEWNGHYGAGGADDGSWQTLEIRAGAMLENRYAPQFGYPWVSFLLIFNTFETDLGLQVAEFRVTAPN